MKPNTKKLKYVYNSVENSKNPMNKKSDTDYESKLVSINAIMWLNQAEINYLEGIIKLSDDIRSKKKEIHNIKNTTIKTM